MKKELYLTIALTLFALRAAAQPPETIPSKSEGLFPAGEIVSKAERVRKAPFWASVFGAKDTYEWQIQYIPPDDPEFSDTKILSVTFWLHDTFGPKTYYSFKDEGFRVEDFELETTRVNGESSLRDILVNQNLPWPSYPDLVSDGDNTLLISDQNTGLNYYTLVQKDDSWSVQGQWRQTGPQDDFSLEARGWGEFQIPYFLTVQDDEDRTSVIRGIHSLDLSRTNRTRIRAERSP